MVKTERADNLDFTSATDRFQVWNDTAFRTSPVDSHLRWKRRKQANYSKDFGRRLKRFRVRVDIFSLWKHGWRMFEQSGQRKEQNCQKHARPEKTSIKKLDMIFPTSSRTILNSVKCCLTSKTETQSLERKETSRQSECPCRQKSGDFPCSFVRHPSEPHRANIDSVIGWWKRSQSQKYSACAVNFHSRMTF